AAIALGGRPGWLAVVGILLGIASIALVSRQTQMPAAPARSSGLRPALASGVAFGLFLFALAQTRPASGLWPLLMARFTSVTLFAVVATVGRRSLRMPMRLGSLAVLCGLIDMLANTPYLLAAQVAPRSRAVTLASLYTAR